MTKAKVYFTDFHMPYGGDPLPVKLHKLMKKAGFENIDMKGKFVAIKMHFGEKATSPSCARTTPKSSPTMSRNWAASPS